MNNEVKNEIIKSFAFGMSAADIAAIEDVPLAEIEAIQNDSAAEIAAKKEWYDKMGGGGR